MFDIRIRFLKTYIFDVFQGVEMEFAQKSCRSHLVFFYNRILMQ